MPNWKQRLANILPTRKQPAQFVNAGEWNGFSGGGGFGRGTQSGGYQNPRSGAGGANDNGVGGYWLPSLFFDDQFLETIHRESWAAEKFIGAPIQDALGNWRIFDDDNEEFNKVEREFDFKHELAILGKAGRLFGTAYLIIATKDSALSEPLNIDVLDRGDFANLIRCDKRYAVPRDITLDYNDRNFGKPEMYRCTFPQASYRAEDVHYSRMLAYHGKEPLSGRWTSGYTQHFGVSELSSVLTSIKEFSEIASGLAHLTTEGSMLVVKMDKFEDYIAGTGDFSPADGDITPDELAQEQARMMTIYRKIFTSKEDDVSRVEVNFSGMADLVNTYAGFLAAASDIPETRFLGTRETGLNVSGVGSAKIYMQLLKGIQTDRYDPLLYILDQVAGKHIGLDEPPTYEWNSPFPQTEAEIAETLDKKASGVQKLVASEIINERKAAFVFDGDPLIGTITDDDLVEFEPLPLPNEDGLNGANGNGLNGTAPIEDLDLETALNGTNGAQN